MPDGNQNLPLPMQYFAFFASLVLAFIKVWDWASPAELHVRVTRDLFFRLIESGEALFCNAILLARNRPVLIRSVQAELHKLNAPKKSFPLDIVQFGEKTKNQGVIADHFFYTSSPLAHVPASVPQRTVYFCIQPSYRETLRKQVDSFQRGVLAVKERIIREQTTVSDVEVLTELMRLVDAHAPTIMEAVQIEEGDYELRLKVEYEDTTRRLFRVKKDAFSAVEFSMGPDVRDVIRANLRHTLLLSGSNVL
jgi:hypothetical protein